MKTIKDYFGTIVFLLGAFCSVTGFFWFIINLIINALNGGEELFDKNAIFLILTGIGLLSTQILTMTALFLYYKILKHEE